LTSWRNAAFCGDGRGAVVRLSLWLLFFAAGSAAAQAQERSARLFWNLESGFGISYHLHERNSDERQVIFAPELVKPLGRHWEYVVEGHLSRFTSPPGYFAGALPVGARYLPLISRLQPFVSVQAGFGWTDLNDIPELSRRFNFLLQGDLGARWNVGEGRSWQVSGRLLHISNGGTREPNLGLNVIVLLVGWRLP